MGALALQAPRISTVWDLPYYFGEAWPRFHLALDGGRGAFDVLASLALVLALAAAGAGIAAALASPDLRQRRLGRPPSWPGRGTSSSSRSSASTATRITTSPPSGCPCSDWPPAWPG